MSDGKLEDSHGSSYGPFGPIFQLIPGVQSYDWGKLADDGSLVAQYAGATKELDFKCAGDRPYAELWMGTHPTLPSSIIAPPGAPAPTSNGITEHISLASYLSQHPALLGKAVSDRFGGPSSGLPFLFKILSIGKALSIQAHPDKTLAERLHAEKPKSYKDANHKPEMTIALTDFRGFCGFRPLPDIVDFIQKIPELRSVVGLSETELASLSSKALQQTPDEAKAILKDLFAKLMKAGEGDVKTQVTSLSQRYNSYLQQRKIGGNAAEPIEVSTDLAQLVVKLNQQYPADVGVLCSFFLNVIDLRPGEAMFLQANEPHAYIEGDIVECMAASDNVVRAGLTPKERDVDVLVDMLTYEMVSSRDDGSKGKGQDEKKLDAIVDSGHKYEVKNTKAEPSTTIYDPPIEEFTVLKTVVASGKEVRHRALNGPSILLITEGKGDLTWLPSEETASQGRTLTLEQPGQVFFVGADSAIELRSRGQGEDLVVFRAFVEV